MMNFYLPDTVNLRTLNYTLLYTMKNQPEMFTECKFAGLYGVLTPTIFAGGRRHFPEYLTESAMRCFLDYCKQNDLEYRFTMTNSKLTEAHLSDTFGNLQLKLAEEYDCPVIVASPLLEKYIRSNYPKIRLMASITMLKSLDDINKMLASDDYCYTVVTNSYNKELDKIDESLRAKAEILVWDCCPPHCPSRARCYADVCTANIGGDCTSYSIVCGHIVADKPVMCVNEQKSAIVHLGFMNPQMCHREMNRICENMTYEEVKSLSDLGYQSFKLSGREQNAIQAMLIYADYFPKAEYKAEFISRMTDYLTV